MEIREIRGREELHAFDGAELVGFAYDFPGFEGEHRVIHPCRNATPS
jgi:hypothetical protein